MADIFHQFSINAPRAQVFQAIATPTGLDAWWTKRCTGAPEMGAEYELWFGPAYDWRAVVTECVTDAVFELQMTSAMEDWLHSRVGFHLAEQDGVTQVRFHHTGWPDASEHFRISSFCWAMYLRLLRRYVEAGEIVPYETRLDV